MSHRLVYVTCENREEAARIAKTVIEERLAACANVLGEITSFFWWEGAVQNGPETSLLLKTRADLMDELTARIKELHGYSCPCVVAIPIEAGNQAFLDWIDAETQK